MPVSLVFLVRTPHCHIILRQFNKLALHLFVTEPTLESVD